ncbi:MAG: hypothetical protein ABIN54_09080 [candidate division WOR-3 bacterium]
MPKGKKEKETLPAPKIRCLEKDEALKLLIKEFPRLAWLLAGLLGLEDEYNEVKKESKK